MSYTKDEIEQIRKRLSQIEDKVAELNVGSLASAKIVARELCHTSYETFLPYQKGEHLRTYEKFWKEKLQSAYEEIDASETIEDVFEKVLEFKEELIQFFQTPQVDTADKATEIAHSFIKKYSPVAFPLKAVKEDNVWVVDIEVGALAAEVGALAAKVAKVKVDARTGDILSYEIQRE